MQSFTHQYAKGARVRYVHAPGGGLISDTLIVTVSIPLDPSDPNYDAQKAADLETAIVAYAKSRGNPYRTIALES